MIFWSPEVKVGEQAAFQLTLTAPSSIGISSIPFSRIALHFSEGAPPVIVEHNPSDEQDSIQTVNIGHIALSESNRPAIKADLRWSKGSSIIFMGSLSSEAPTVFKVGFLYINHRNRLLICFIRLHPWSLPLRRMDGSSVCPLIHAVDALTLGYLRDGSVRSSPCGWSNPQEKIITLLCTVVAYHFVISDTFCLELNTEHTT